jgi:isoleucyl-tRNA synthetase
VLNLVLSRNEESYNVQYSVTADFAVLGKKLRKDLGRVKKALPGVTSDQVRAFQATGKMVLDGIPLGAEDLVVQRGLKDGGDKNQEFNTDNDVIVLLDMAMDAELHQQGLAREVINRVQQLRKKAGLVPTDDVGMEYRVLEDPEDVGLEKMFETQCAMMEKALRRPMDKHVVTEFEGKIPDKKEEVIAQEEQEVQKARFLLRLVKL